jgi:acetyl-CoA carboxylase carboxyl transferase subunit alpha
MWKDPARKQQAAAALRYTATNVKNLGCVDDIIPEPEGGSQVDPACAMAIVNEQLERHFQELKTAPIDELIERRYQKFRNMAQFYTNA